jgi:hypothetical protein
MLVTLDLNSRQAARVLNEAIHAHATLEIEPRPEVCEVLIWGVLTGQCEEGLTADLRDVPEGTNLRALLGAMCDIRLLVSGQLCLFSSFVVDVAEDTVPRKMTLALPDSFQIANRRRFARKVPTDPVPVRLLVPGSQPPFVGLLCNIGPGGLACRVVSRQLDEVVFVGDEVQLQFTLPWCPEVFILAASVCNKSRNDADGQTTIGLEFVAAGHEATLERLRGALDDQAAHLVQKDGDL